MQQDTSMDETRLTKCFVLNAEIEPRFQCRAYYMDFAQDAQVATTKIVYLIIFERKQDKFRLQSEEESRLQAFCLCTLRPFIDFGNAGKLSFFLQF